MKILEKKMIVDKQGGALIFLLGGMFVMLGLAVVLIGIAFGAYVIPFGLVPVAIGLTTIILQIQKNKKLGDDSVSITIKKLAYVKEIVGYKLITYSLVFEDNTEIESRYLKPKSLPGDPFYFVEIMGTSKSNNKAFPCDEYELADDLKDFLVKR